MVESPELVGVKETPMNGLIVPLISYGSKVTFVNKLQLYIYAS